MAFIALKPCSFAGKHFKIGEEIPDGLVLSDMAPRLIKMGKIAEAQKTSVPEPQKSESEPESEPEPEPKSKRAKNKKPGGD